LAAVAAAALAAAAAATLTGAAAEADFLVVAAAAALVVAVAALAAAAAGTGSPPVCGLHSSLITPSFAYTYYFAHHWRDPLKSLLYEQGSDTQLPVSPNRKIVRQAQRGAPR
jgi:outer membrane protein W